MGWEYSREMKPSSGNCFNILIFLIKVSWVQENVKCSCFSYLPITCLIIVLMKEVMFVCSADFSNSSTQIDL